MRVRRVNRCGVEHFVLGVQGAPGSVEATCIVRTKCAHHDVISAEEWAEKAEEGEPT